MCVAVIFCAVLVPFFLAKNIGMEKCKIYLTLLHLFQNYPFIFFIVPFFHNREKYEDLSMQECENFSSSFVLSFIKVIVLSCLGLDDPLLLPYFTPRTPEFSEDDDEPVLALSQHRPPFMDIVQPSSLAVGYGLSPVISAGPGKLRLVDLVTVNFERKIDWLYVSHKNC